jgi:hypothetical protein
MHTPIPDCTRRARLLARPGCVLRVRPPLRLPARPGRSIALLIDSLARARAGLRMNS